MADGNMANFLATDKVPDTIFGIPVVSRREDYTTEERSEVIWRGRQRCRRTSAG